MVFFSELFQVKFDPQRNIRKNSQIDTIILSTACLNGTVLRHLSYAYM